MRGERYLYTYTVRINFNVLISVNFRTLNNKLHVLVTYLFFFLLLTMELFVFLLSSFVTYTMFIHVT